MQRVIINQPTTPADPTNAGVIAQGRLPTVPALDSRVPARNDPLSRDIAKNQQTVSALWRRQVSRYNAAHRRALFDFHCDPMSRIDLETAVRYAGWRENLADAQWPLGGIDEVAKLFGVALTADEKAQIAGRFKQLAHAPDVGCPEVVCCVVPRSALKSEHKAGMVRVCFSRVGVAYPEADMAAGHFRIAEDAAKFVYGTGKERGELDLKDGITGRDDLDKLLDLIAQQAHVSHAHVKFGEHEHGYYYSWRNEAWVCFATATKIDFGIHNHGHYDPALCFALLDLHGEPLDQIFITEGARLGGSQVELNTFSRADPERPVRYAALLKLGSVA